MSLVLPWEVLERIIDHAHDDLALLRYFSLTCRQLRPRSLWLLMNHFHFVDRDQTYAFCDFIQAKPKFLPLIQSLFVCPGGFPPYPLLDMLPNLSSLRFIIGRFKEYASRDVRPTVHLHPSTLLSYQISGKAIRTVSLDCLSFQTACDVFRLILAFPNVTKVICHDILVKSHTISAPAMDLVESKLSKQLRLKGLEVRLFYCFYAY